MAARVNLGDSHIHRGDDGKYEETGAMPMLALGIGLRLASQVATAILSES
jgi:hypothetical protein